MCTYAAYYSPVYCCLSQYSMLALSPVPIFRVRSVRVFLYTGKIGTGDHVCNIAVMLHIVTKDDNK